MYGNGGILGGPPPTRTGAPGVWKLSQIAAARANEIWPTLKDPSFASVVFLEHFEGVSGKEHFANYGSGTPGLAANPSVAATRADLTNAASKFGKTSLSVNSTNVIARTGPTSVAAYALGTGDFTIEFWIYPTSALVSGRHLFDMRTGGINGAFPRIYCNSDGSVRYYVSSADRITSAAGALVTGQWQHVAVARVSGTTRMFIDGTQVGSNYTDSTNYGNATINCMASGGGGVALIGYFDECRVTKGVGRYSANFTPPTLPFEDY